jgi:hypothetical protein
LIGKIILKIAKKSEGEFMFTFHGSDLPEDFNTLQFDGEWDNPQTSIEEEIKKDIEMVGKPYVSEFDKFKKQLEENSSIVSFEELDSILNGLESDQFMIVGRISENEFPIFLEKEVK